MRRPCDCPHGFPVCACAEGLRGAALLARSRWLSSLAGWPARPDVPPAWLALPRVTPAAAAAGADCGCNRGRA